MNYLCIDVGTTCCKCQLFSESGEILEYISREYELLREGAEVYVDAAAIRAHVLEMIKTVAKKQEIGSVAVSSLGEAFVLLDKDDRILFNPMLYTDRRGEEEAREITERLGEERVASITGNSAHAMFSVSKLMWIKKHYPKLYERADKALLICDYIGYILTGERVIDYSLAARSGAFDVSALEFSDELLSAVGINKSLFSRPAVCGSVVGRIKAELVKELSVTDGAVLVLGAHDQVCSALGAGAISAGDAVDGLGTVECITVLFEGRPKDSLAMSRMGYPTIPYAIPGLYCTYILNLSSGSTVNWYRKRIAHGYSGEKSDFFSYMESEMKDSPTGVLVLPYFGGAATPYQNGAAKGAIIGLTTELTDSELYRALLEGCAMEMRLNCEVVRDFGIEVVDAVATGGGANSRPWMQLKADIQNISYKTLRSSEGGLCGCAMLSAVAMGKASGLDEAKAIFVRYKDAYAPRKEMTLAYAPKYEKYKKIYNTVKELF